MEHIQKRNDYLIENDAEQKVIPVNYDEKNLLFLSQLISFDIKNKLFTFMHIPNRPFF